ncbi:spore coat U domain-containing protein [Mesorhizobium sp. M0622]|uniref:Csu type fimbrial protein n=1 Tax=unclassified Mesorhizobium TaxID=325217 RepID=UPI00333DE3C0
MTNSAFAVTAAGSMTVRLTITNQCKVQTAGDLNFGSHGVIDGNVEETSTIGVQCTSGQTYNVGLGAGAGTGATVAVRKMTSPAAATVNYTMYSNSARTLVWGDTVNTDTVTGTGDGNVQNLTVYGRVPAQLTPAAGDYTDTVAITITY